MFFLILDMPKTDKSKKNIQSTITFYIENK